VDETSGGRLVPRWFDAFTELNGIARRHGWRVLEPAAGDRWMVGWEAETGTRVFWYEDPDTDVEYAVVEGAARARIENLIRAEMELLTPENFAKAIASYRAPLLRGKTLMAIATAAIGPPDEIVSSLVNDALSDADPYIRRYGLYAVQVLGWPALKAAAERLRVDDVDSDVRATASEVLGD
jgi:hypothetical protein